MAGDLGVLCRGKHPWASAVVCHTPFCRLFEGWAGCPLVGSFCNPSQSQAVKPLAVTGGTQTTAGAEVGNHLVGAQMKAKDVLWRSAPSFGSGKRLCSCMPKQKQSLWVSKPLGGHAAHGCNSAEQPFVLVAQKVTIGLQAARYNPLDGLRRGCHSALCPAFGRIQAMLQRALVGCSRVSMQLAPVSAVGVSQAVRRPQVRVT